MLIGVGCTGTARGIRGEPRQVVIPEGSASLPVDWWCDFAIVPVMLDGFGPFNFLLDTGADETIVTPGIAQLFPESTFRVSRRIRG